ncbi:hypothetical protein KDH_48850 [Dictyobacter sp. S3.2.2.5]|uniref:Uncharacterized protein n=1 Tax=Dictyobacter halimunensis TaxID=3026934 RepID=A0ABQ6FYY9_9CHLR|nr:hypothetical protein KDH_48850 [Dictyobacter sp. S3.2.2.5]
MQKVSTRPAISKTQTTGPDKSNNLLYRYGLDLLVVLAMGFLLYKGLFGQSFSDVPGYQCYATVFGGVYPHSDRSHHRNVIM